MDGLCVCVCISKVAGVPVTFTTIVGHMLRVNVTSVNEAL